MTPERLRLREHAPDELAHYAKKAVDVEYRFPFGWKELEGVHNRGDFDLSRHSAASGENLEYFDQATNEHVIPWVVETAAGADRAAFTFLIDAYREEEVRGETRVSLALHPDLAPYKVAVLPLLKKRPEIVELCHRIKDDLKRHMMAVYDDTAAIGKLYRRQDEIGTPWCVTVDVDSLEDGAVTVRDRDSMAQERVPVEGVTRLILDRLEARAGGARVTSGRAGRGRCRSGASSATWSGSPRWRSASRCCGSGMRAVMDLGGFCASGGPYEIAVECPDAVVASTPLSIIGGFLAAASILWGGAGLGGAWASLVFLAWPALFLSLGWNFLEYGFFPPEGGWIWSWIFCGVLFVLMGAIPLVVAIAASGADALEARACAIVVRASRRRGRRASTMPTPDRPPGPSADVSPQARSLDQAGGSVADRTGDGSLHCHRRVRDAGRDPGMRARPRRRTVALKRRTSSCSRRAGSQRSGCRGGLSGGPRLRGLARASPTRQPCTDPGTFHRPRRHTLRARHERRAVTKGGPWTSESSSSERSEAIMTPSPCLPACSSRGWTRRPA